jgi:phage-related protein
MAAKAKSAGSNFINGAVNFIKQLPGKIWSFLSNAVQKVGTWGSNMVSKAKSGMARVVSSVTSTLKSLPGKVLSVGKNLVTGLWNGITNKLSWLKNKIKSFTKSVMDSIKSFFGVKSPSRETAWVGEMLDEGLAVGLDGNARAPIKAMQRVTGGVLDAAQGVNGLQVERSITRGNVAAQTAAAVPMGMGDKLDKILAAIEKGQVLLLDGKTFIGATAAGYDKTLGQRQVLAARGAL